MSILHYLVSGEMNQHLTQSRSAQHLATFELNLTKHLTSL